MVTDFKLFGSIRKEPDAHFKIDENSRNSRLSSSGHVESYISLICDNSVTTQNFLFFQEECLKILEVLYFTLSATTTQLLSSGEVCKLRYDTIPVKSASAKVSFYTNNSKKFQIMSCDTLVANERCRKHHFVSTFNVKCNTIF